MLGKSRGRKIDLGVGVGDVTSSGGGTGVTVARLVSDTCAGWRGEVAAAGLSDVSPPF